MPSNNSWNGKWSGDGRLFAKVVNMGKTKRAAEKVNKILDEGSFYYRWEDGWCACVKVRKVNVEEANRLRRKSEGFCGYDWMVTSIIDNL